MSGLLPCLSSSSDVLELPLYMRMFSADEAGILLQQVLRSVKECLGPFAVGRSHMHSDIYSDVTVIPSDQIWMHHRFLYTSSRTCRSMFRSPV